MALIWRIYRIFEGGRDTKVNYMLYGRSSPYIYLFTGLFIYLVFSISDIPVLTATFLLVLDDSGGLSNGGKVGLIVFFVLLIVIIFSVGGVYYYKRRTNGFKLQFAHKAFDNPVHMNLNNDELKFMQDED